MAESRSSAVAGTKQAPGEYRERGLELLAEEIRGHHKAVERHARSMLAEAILAGEKLLEAKELLRHGEFGPWLTYCGVNQRTAQLYMKLAREKRNVAVLEADSIRGALEGLGGKKKQGWKFLPPPPAGSRGVCVDTWREAMAAQGRREVFAYSIRDERYPNTTRRCFTTVEAEAYDRKTADSAVEALPLPNLDGGES
jgi:Protein of unknown function (DUF3102)